MQNIKLIVGLGNPGPEYQKTKHNVGFLVVDQIARILNLDLNKKDFNGIFYKDQNFILAKPLTYMNNSGFFVNALVKFYKIKPENILIISDDVDHNVGQSVIKLKGSSGGQNGLKSIINQLGTEAIPRLKIGIGRSANKPLAAHVLTKFSTSDQKIIDQIIVAAAAAGIAFLTKDINKIMNEYNEKYKKNSFSS
ncbi:aminoacyl-tRNA hydrolase [Candidatus Mycoplasma pogonae]